MARFEIVTRSFDQPTRHAEAVLAVIKTRDPAPFMTRQQMVLEALNTLPLRQRFVSHEVRQEMGKWHVDMLVENLS